MCSDSKKTGGNVQKGDQSVTGTGAWEIKVFVWISELKHPVHILVDIYIYATFIT
jgi:hypothetical protein